MTVTIKPTRWKHYSGFEGQGTTETECYANLINNIWDYLTDYEKQTITDILNQ